MEAYSRTERQPYVCSQQDTLLVFLLCSVMIFVFIFFFSFLSFFFFLFFFIRLLSHHHHLLVLPLHRPLLIHHLYIWGEPWGSRFDSPIK